MGGDGSASGGCWLRDTTCLTATASAAGRLPPTFSSVSSRLLDLYRECVDNSGWARVRYNARGGMEKLIFIRKVQPTPAPAASAPPRKPGRPASDRRRARDKRRRKACAERRSNRSQSRLHTQPEEDDLLSVPDMAATATISVAVSPPPQPPDASTSQPASSASPSQASPLPASSPLASSPSASPLPQPAPPPRKRAKTYSEATRASSRAAVLAKRRQIPQLNGCISPPSLPSPSSPPSQPATSPAAKPPFLPASPATSPAQEAPLPRQASLPRRASPRRTATPTGTDPTRCTAATPAARLAEAPSSSGYTLVLMWCPSCKTNMIDNRDYECYMCQEKRYYRSLEYEDE
jgi:hypothetical protein